MVPLSFFFGPPSVSFFLPWEANTQLNHWTKQICFLFLLEGCGVDEHPFFFSFLAWRRHILCFKVGLGISRTNVDSQWNPFTRHFIEFVVVEMKEFVRRLVGVGSNVNET